MAAGWGRPLLASRARLAALELPVSLGGAAGTLAAMGPEGPQVRARLAARLGLADPGASWHGDRRPVGALVAALTELLGSLGKMGEDVLLLAQSGIGELRLAGAGGSSTMPQKANPVGPSALVALARTGIGMAGMVHGAALHRQGRDGAAWMTERLALPQVLAVTGGALARAGEMVEGLAPDPAAMARNMAAGGGAIHAEALAFALARRMPLAQAQAEVGALVAQAGERTLAELVRERHPGLGWTGPDLGQAPAEARAFAAEAGKA
jgi:3-carboxy-cis,cis-muconate cycloisomerase